MALNYKPMKLVILAATLLAVCAAKRLDKEKVVFAINCAANKPVKSADGYTYEAVSSTGPTAATRRHRGRQLVGNGLQVRTGQVDLHL
jgi:hypothetical protein